ncbi:MAG: hypothetical protein ABSH09_19170 [Bryobacteraceae bacterium]|jgi:hypothetical protein
MKSNTLRLALGWVFLMLLTAGGTFYAADALDQHGALDKLALHDKFGYTKATIASVPTQGTGAASSSAPAGSGTSAAPNNSQIAQYNGSNQQPQLPPQPQQTQQTLPNASQLFPQASQQQQPQQAQQALPNASQLFPQASQQQQPQVAPQQQPRNQQQPVPQNNQPPQISQQQLSQQQQAQNNRPQQAVRTMSPALRDRLTDVVSRAEATFAQWQPIKRSLQSMGQPLRPEISAALGSLQRYTQQAQSLARSGDAAGAEHALDMAEKQMQILKEARE